jgi:hypothetical protein
MSNEKILRRIESHLSMLLHDVPDKALWDKVADILSDTRKALEAAKPPQQPDGCFHAWFMSEPHRAKYFTSVPDGSHPAYMLAKEAWEHRRESSGVHGYEISGNTIYIGPMRRDRVKVAEIVCTIDWDETYTDEAKARRIRDAERICRGLDRE